MKSKIIGRLTLVAVIAAICASTFYGDENLGNIAKFFIWVFGVLFLICGLASKDDAILSMEKERSKIARALWIILIFLAIYSGWFWSGGFLALSMLVLALRLDAVGKKVEV